MFKSTLRLLLVVGVFTALYVGVSSLFASSMDGENMNLARCLLIEARRSEALQLRAAEMAQSMEMKKSIIDDLIAARLTLGEAEEKFRDAGSMVEADRDGLLPTYRAPETEQGLCRQVLAWTASRLKDNYTPKVAKQVRRRLRHELKELFPHDKIIN